MRNIFRGDVYIYVLLPFSLHFMTREEFLRSYIESNQVKSLARDLENNTHLYLKGLSGSLPAVIASAIFKLKKETILIALSENEEAAYFFSDLREFVDEKELLFFPASYKRPYHYEEIDNANVTRLNKDKSEPAIIVTYANALFETVVNKRSLSKNTFQLFVNDVITQEELIEVLNNFEFEKSDFVYEAGQFAVRGGIIARIFIFEEDFVCHLNLSIISQIVQVNII